MHYPGNLYRKIAILILLVALSLLVMPTAAQGTLSLPLAGNGPYAVGFKIVQFKDGSRGGRTLSTYVWYPAITPAKPTPLQTRMNQYGWLNATPDLQTAFYPLIIVSPGQALSAVEYTAIILPLVSRGFVVAGLTHPDEQAPSALIDRPLDIIFVLDQLTATNKSDFDGVIDTDHVGVIGHSFGGYTTIAVTGARVDPISAGSWGAQPAASGDDADPHTIWMAWNWNSIVAYRAKLSPVNDSDLWSPVAAKHILAAIAFAPCYIPMFGERGLAAATVPTLIVSGTGDTICPYTNDAAYAFAHLGSPAHYLLSIVDGGHESFQNAQLLPAITHLDAAFFGYYLRDQKDYAQYLTASYIDAISAHDQLPLKWGLYDLK